MLRLFLLPTLALLILAACSDAVPHADPAAAPPTDEQTPAAAEIRDAVNFTVEYRGAAKIVHVLQTTPGAAGAVYVLVQRGAAEPEGGWAALADALRAEHELGEAAVLEVPVRSIFTSSTTQLPALEILGELERLSGVAQAGLVSSEAVRARIDAGGLVEFAPMFAVDAEVVLAAQPEVLMTSGFWDDAYDVIQSAGTVIVHNADWVESNPLGRAEWVKFISLFFNREAEAEDWYKQVRADYLATRSLAASAETAPTVHTGLVWGDVWLAAGGGSYLARLLADAGADYVWADDSSVGSLQHDFETQLARASAAEFWLNSGSEWATTADAVAEDERYGEFASLQQGNLWNPNGRVSESGADDFYELGAVRPDIVLADLIAIFHPQLMPDYEIVFYERIGSD